MTHLPDLISDLALILITAAIVTVIFQKLKQPLVLGYLLAGVLVGSSVSIFPDIQDPQSIQVWAEIGVIFLLFGLGLEFSYSKLAQYGKSAGMTATVEIVFMMGLGYLTGRGLGWSHWDSIFLGGILAMSSTSIIVRAFDELNLKSKAFAQFVFGVLVFEDLFAILLLVAFSAIGASSGELGLGWLSVIPFLLFFLILTFTIGVYMVPQVFKRLKKEMTDETLTILSIGLCLVLVVLATKSGFSPALGAFLMGSIIGGTKEAHRIELLLQPVKNLFSAVFFVSVGMLLEPRYLVEYWASILIIIAITIIGKGFSTALGAVVSGLTPRDSMRAGLSMAQIGEFGFIIATLGVTLKLTSPFLYPITVAVSVITTFTTPYLMIWSGPIATWLENRMSDRLRERISDYRQAVNTASGSDLKSLIFQAFGFAPLINMVLVIASIYGIRNWVVPWTEDLFPPVVRPYIYAFGTLLLVAPFLWGIMHSRARVRRDLEGTDMRAVFFGVLIARAFLSLVLVFFIFGTFITDSLVSLILITMVFLALFFGRRWLEPAYRRFEGRFLENLLAEGPHGEPGPAAKPLMHLTPWDAQLKKVQVSPDSKWAAHTLLEANLREAYGVMVALIDRGSRQIMTPGRDELLLPGDTLYMIGTEEQIERARGDLEFVLPESHAEENIGLAPLKLGSDSPFLKKSIRDSGLREATHGLIVGMERAGSRILNPDSTIALEEGDLLWIVGRRDLIQELA
ncbi:MAG: cation:proton antiporter [Bdellovibrionaceae bacterium]|nr:cation:proton antiporter [Pseudobdellovibrionaceae bacterium]